MPARLLFSAAAAFALMVEALSAAPIEIIPSDFLGPVQPQVAIAPSGRIHVVFGKDDSVFHVTSADGRTFSAPVKIAALGKLALRMRRGPRVTATDDRVLVTAISHSDGNLHAWTSADDGRTWMENPPLNTTPGSAREGLQALAGDGRGLVTAVWLDHRNDGTEIWGRVSRDGGSTWDTDLLIYQSPDGHVCECCVPNVAISSTGQIAVMWRNWLDGSRDLYLASSRDGHTFSAAQKLGTGTWKLNGCPMDGGSLAFAPGGSWLALWRRDRTIFSTNASLPELQLSTDATQPVIGYAGDTPLILWETKGALVLQRGDAPPERFAETAAAVSIASGNDSAAVVCEASVKGKKTLVFDRMK